MKLHYTVTTEIIATPQPNYIIYSKLFAIEQIKQCLKYLKKKKISTQLILQVVSANPTHNVYYSLRFIQTLHEKHLYYQPPASGSIPEQS